ncbi:hypothetical protein [Nostoc sp. T09]|uniref:hypothetical protein n=1 Tax=Nostoc sp. T09 TaxID=1932621 RepID=UPI00117EFC0B|nr:hypothetical protein [Nostoc sp. T09]
MSRSATHLWFSTTVLYGDRFALMRLSNQNNLIGDRSHWQVEVVNIVGKKILGFVTSISPARLAIAL